MHKVTTLQQKCLELELKVLYLDESGDHNLDKIDPRYPVFVLGGVIVDRDEMLGNLTNLMNRLKRDHFGDHEVILHTADITRRRGDFAILNDPAVRSLFLDDLNKMMELAEVKVVACIIDKASHKRVHGDSAYDPYHLAMEVVIERFSKEIGDISHGGIVVAERRGNELDAAIERAWIDICRRGTRYTKPSVINQRIVDMVLRDKALNILGLQLADLVVSPIGRYAIGKEPREDWHIVESKLCRRPSGSVEGYGIVRLPKARR